jgi:hypothetical protein
VSCPSCRAENEAGAASCAACGCALESALSLRPGSLLAGRYEILEPLGAGGMGVVFKAHDRLLDETVAVKTLRPAATQRPELASRLRSEIKLAWKVRHRNVCGIHEYGEDGEILYISMEHVAGRDLKRLLREGGALPWQQAYDVVLQVADGLEAIHEAGVIHRDLKPANIMVDARGLVRLMDFGIAKVWAAQDRAGLTGTGHVVGSPEYMSPEQVRGKPLDFRSDLYAFGVVVFEVFTGRAPLRADTPVATMLLHLEAEPPLDGPLAAHLPAALVPVLRQALAKDPRERFADCRAMRAALRGARAALPQQVTDALPGPAPAPAAAPVAQPVAAARRSRALELLVPSLVRALRHPDAAIRAAAAQALGRAGIDGRVAAVPLIAALQDESWEVRRDAAGALGIVGREGGPASAALAAATRDGEEAVRAAAAEALGRLAPALP